MIRLSMYRNKLVLSTAVIVATAFCLWLGVGQVQMAATTKVITGNGGDSEIPAATFNANAGTLGSIPDGTGVPTVCGNDGSPRNVTFTVSGISGPPSDVQVNMTFAPAHTWRSDLTATLIAPNGTSMNLFRYIGTTTAGGCGDANDFVGPYNFKDSAAGTNIWSVLSSPTAAGDYRTTANGGAGQTNPAPFTNLSAAFAGIPTSNGTWTLRITDGGIGDTGAISAATLTLTGAAPAVLQHVGDYDGDGKTDFAVVRDNGSGLVGQADPFFYADSIREKLRIQSEMPDGGSSEVPGPVGSSVTWYVNRSDGGAPIITAFGVAATDFFVPNDYDGDSKTDIAVWRPGAPTDAAFYVLQSSNSTVVITPFGQTGDDAAITGDYDGDGKADLATYRCPALGAGDGQCFFYFKGTLNNPSGNITYVPWGFGETFDFFVSPGDFDGDGKYDFCIQRTHPTLAGSGQFVLRRSSDGGVEYINWGRDSDIIVPGDYDGDGKSDFMVSRSETISGVAGRSYYLLTRTGATSFARWGIFGDVRTPGDYDGDGKTDLAIWRPNANPDQNNFWVRRSSDLTAQVFEWGQQGDFAVASWNVH